MQKIILTTLIIVIAISSFAQTPKPKSKTTVKAKTKATIVKPSTEVSTATTVIPADAVHIFDSNKNDVELTATNKAIVIEGNNNQINITGNCKQIFITGKSNDITIESLDFIEITGESNFVSWEKSSNTSGKPIIRDKGGYNNVGKKSGNSMKKNDN